MFGDSLTDYFPMDKLKDIDADFKEMNSVWDAWVEKGFAPARACVEAKMAREALLVEISIVAAVK